MLEAPSELGLAHFTEHMLFKGTKRRTAKQIAEAMDSVGGQLNAFTAKECTCFYSKVMDIHLEKCLDLLSDMAFHSVFDREEMEKEKGVILEEIYMADDSPEDLVHDLLAEAFFGSHPLAQPILGTIEGISAYTREELIRFYDAAYRPEQMVLSIAGNYEADALKDLAEHHFGSWQGGTKSHTPVEKGSCCREFLYRHKDIEQMHICLGSPGIPLGRQEQYPLMLFNNIFGGGMSSRLFQHIREDRGLTYSVFSYPSNYTCDGLFTIYASMKPAQAPEVLNLIKQEIESILNSGVTEEEFHIGREQLKGNYILGMESTSSRMTALGRAELLLGRAYPPEEILAMIEATTPEMVQSVIEKVFEPDTIAAAMVGPEDITQAVKDMFKRR